MRRIYIILIVLSFSRVGLFAQNEESGITKKRKLPVGWNTTLGISAGYSKMYAPFNSEYYGINAPVDLVNLDLSIYGVYVGMDFMCKNTGYDVYGYNEQITTMGMRFGPSIRVGSYRKWRCVVSPFLGFIGYSVSDTSENSIGARDEYGTKEKHFIGGCKISAVYNYFLLGVHCSNKEWGVSIGVDLPNWL
ncbi:MAG: hypothetical protein J6B31_06805 [Bacteroidaceae bacterium]|nr:hypothetical protein [Bacteroidaceae bacterium]